MNVSPGLLVTKVHLLSLLLAEKTVISNLQLEKSLVCDVTKDSDDGFLPVRTRGGSNKGAF